MNTSCQPQVQTPSNQACCPTAPSPNAAATCDCPVSQAICDCEAPCPVETAIRLNTKSLSAAMHAVQVDILKEKIREQWGAVMEKEADAVLETAGTLWKATLTQAKAKKALREQFCEIFSEVEES